MNSKVTGYLLCEDSYVWTKRGLLKVKELLPSDSVLGLDLEKRKVVFEKMRSKPVELKSNRSVRITTDVNELVLPENSEVYTVKGKIRALNITQGVMVDIFYRPQIFEFLRNLYKSNPLASMKIGDRRIIITKNIAYMLGTQAIVPRLTRHKLVLYLKSGLNYAKVCKILKHALTELKTPHRIYYRPTDYRKIVIYDDSQEKFLIRMILSLFRNYDVPKVIRISPTIVIQQFIEGLLDSRAKISKGSLIKLHIPAPLDRIRRFIYSGLALFDVQPRYTYVNKPKRGLKSFSLYFALPKKRPFELKSLALSSTSLAIRTREDMKVYSQVKHAVRLRRQQFIVPRIREHWDIITDLVPLHYQTIELE